MSITGFWLPLRVLFTLSWLLNKDAQLDLVGRCSLSRAAKGRARLILFSAG